MQKILEKVTIKFSGDSGDGIQLLGNEFTKTSAVFGNDLDTLPDFPAEIRAPAGTIAGISGFQIQLGSVEINSPGEELDVLVAFNPSALKANLKLLKKNGILIINQHTFEKKGLKLANFDHNPLLDDSLKSYQVFALDITKFNKTALSGLDLKAKAKDKSKNFYVLGMLIWLYGRSLEKAIAITREKFANQPNLAEINLISLKAGYAYAEASELFKSNYKVPPAKLEKGKYRHISGNEAISLGILTFFHKSGLKVVYTSYPITPASDILTYIKRFESYGLVSLQAEDEMSAAGIALGSSFSGGVGITASSGPGITLKMETINLAVMTELPLVIINVQRAGPSTGMPTKTEQGDLLQAFYGRHGESHLPILAPTSPSDCFNIVIEAFKLATQYMTPVIILSDGYLANGSEPWKIPQIKNITIKKIERAISQKDLNSQANTFLPYLRDEKTLARPWAIPGMKNFQHRIGGLEKEKNTGNVNYEGENHEEMSTIRKEKIARIALAIPDLEILGDKESDLLVVGWGSTFGVIKQTIKELALEGHRVAHIQLKYLNPFPKNLLKIINHYKKIIVAEINFGQLHTILRARSLKKIELHYELKGLPLNIKKLKQKILSIKEK